MANTFHLAVIGEPSVGKTTYLQRLITGEFTKAYAPTKSGQQFVWRAHCRSARSGLTAELSFVCTEGNAAASVITPTTQGVLLFYRVGSQASFAGMLDQLRLVQAQWPQLPVVVLANMYDLKGPKYTKYMPDVVHWLTSGKSNYNIEKPFATAMRTITGDETLDFVLSPAVEPPEVIVDQRLLARYRQVSRLL
jgi:GTP-binding nuclear protein Ran